MEFTELEIGALFVYAGSGRGGTDDLYLDDAGFLYAPSLCVKRDGTSFVRNSRVVEVTDWHAKVIRMEHVGGGRIQVSEVQ